MPSHGDKKARLRGAAIQALMTSSTLAAAATKAGVSETTLLRWQRDPEFAADLHAAQDAAIQQTAHALAALAPGAINAIAAALSQSEPTALRLSGARLALDKLVDLTELASMARRLDALERALEARANEKQ